LCNRTGLGIELPMMQASVGSVAAPELVAAVSKTPASRHVDHVSEQAATRVGLLHGLAM
jgi:NAD(P)H-dependent flavin oxidoreductase YrpB (nitropropane dioxygenase family)